MKASEEFAKMSYLSILVCMAFHSLCDYSKDIFIVPCVFLVMAIIALVMEH